MDCAAVDPHIQCTYIIALGKIHSMLQGMPQIITDRLKKQSNYDSADANANSVASM